MLHSFPSSRAPFAALRSSRPIAGARVTTLFPLTPVIARAPRQFRSNPNLPHASRALIGLAQRAHPLLSERALLPAHARVSTPATRPLFPFLPQRARQAAFSVAMLSSPHRERDSSLLQTTTLFRSSMIPASARAERFPELLLPPSRDLRVSASGISPTRRCKFGKGDRRRSSFHHFDFRSVISRSVNESTPADVISIAIERPATMTLSPRAKG